MGLPSSAADPAPQLVKLGEPEPEGDTSRASGLTEGDRPRVVRRWFHGEVGAHPTSELSSAVPSHLSACSTTMMVASGTSTPTSTTIVQMRAGVRPSRKEAITADFSSLDICQGQEDGRTARKMSRIPRADCRERAAQQSAKDKPYPSSPARAAKHTCASRTPLTS